MSATLTFPMPLAEKYRPRMIAEFVGLDKPKRILSKFAANPYQSAWLFVGPPGTGKTSMALALAETLRAEVHHIPSQQCNVANVEDVIRQCWYVPVSRADSISCLWTKPTRCQTLRNSTFSRSWMQRHSRRRRFSCSPATQRMAWKRVFSPALAKSSFQAMAWQRGNAIARIHLAPRGKWRIGTQSRPHREGLVEQRPRCADVP